MKDRIVRVRFTAKEYDWIRNFRSSNKIKNDNQLFRQAIENMIGVHLANAEKNPVKLPLKYLGAYEYRTKLLKTFSKNPRTKSIIEKVFNQWKSDILTKWADYENKKYPRSNLMLDDFKARKRGRPKKPKKRGRPADKGFEG